MDRHSISVPLLHSCVMDGNGGWFWRLLRYRYRIAKQGKLYDLDYSENLVRLSESVKHAQRALEILGRVADPFCLSYTFKVQCARKRLNVGTHSLRFSSLYTTTKLAQTSSGFGSYLTASSVRYGSTLNAIQPP